MSQGCALGNRLRRAILDTETRGGATRRSTSRLGGVYRTAQANIEKLEERVAKI